MVWGTSTLHQNRNGVQDGACTPTMFSYGSKSARWRPHHCVRTSYHGTVRVKRLNSTNLKHHIIYRSLVETWKFLPDPPALYPCHTKLQRSHVARAHSLCTPKDLRWNLPEWHRDAKKKQLGRKKCRQIQNLSGPKRVPIESRCVKGEFDLIRLNMKLVGTFSPSPEITFCVALMFAVGPTTGQIPDSNWWCAEVRLYGSSKFSSCANVGIPSTNQLHQLVHCCFSRGRSEPLPFPASAMAWLDDSF